MTRDRWRNLHPADVAGYPEEQSRHLWDQRRSGALDLDTEAAR